MSSHLIVQTDDVESTTNFTQQVRLKLLDQLCPSGRLPSEGEDAKVVMALLNNIDASTINVAKLKIEKTKNDTTAESNILVAALLKQVSVSQQSIDVIPTKEITQQIDNKLSQFSIPEDNTILPGVLQRGVVDDTYEDFMKRNNAE